MKVGQRNTLSKVWSKNGKRPEVPRQQQYLYTNLFGAVNVLPGETESIIIDYSGYTVTEELLELISKRTKPTRIAVVILDKAAWHTTSKIKKFDNLVLLPLPPYSPELNSIEQVWAYLRRHYLSNRIFLNFDDIVTSLSDAWLSLSSSPHILKSIVFRDYMAI